MDIVKRLLGVFLIVIALVVAVNLMATPLYHDGSDDYPVWKILNWFMAVGVVVALIVNAMRKRAMSIAGAEPSVREYLRVNLTYYTAIILTILFFWEWFWTLNPDSETSDGAITSHMVYFPIMDSLFAVVCLATGRYLWGDASGAGG